MVVGQRAPGHLGVDHKAHFHRLRGLARPIGVLTTEDENEQDDKILGVPVDDPRFQEIQDIGDIAKHLKTEIADFSVLYKRLEPKKWVLVKGGKDAKAAEKMILAAFQLYKEEFHST